MDSTIIMVIKEMRECQSKPSGGYVTRSSFRKQFHILSEKAGVRKIRFHDLRHGFATMLKKKGWDPKVAQELLGHSDVRITMDVYQHNDDVELKAAVNSLLPGLKDLLDGRKSGQRSGQRTVNRGKLRVIK